jgi:hypothetical protein
MKKAKLTSTYAERNCCLFRLGSAKGEAQKQEDEHMYKALRLSGKRDQRSGTKKKKAADKKTADLDKTQPSEDARDEARWLDESDRRDATADADHEGKVISLQESSRSKDARLHLFLPS